MVSNDPLLSVEYLSKSFPSGHEVVEILKTTNLTLFGSSTTSIQGASGSGKTTLLNLIAGLDNIDSGEVRWEGRSIKLLSDYELHQYRARFIGFIFQHYSLLPELSVLENVLLPGRIIGNYDPDRAEELIKRVGLEAHKLDSPRTLSGGERQRVAIARALYNRPKLILADEPTGNLDEVSAREIVDLLWEVTAEQHAALILITHNPVFAKRADYRYRLSEGKLWHD